MLRMSHKIEDALLEALVLTRFGQDNKSMLSVLNPKDFNELKENVVNELNEAGLHIVEKKAESII